MSLNPKNYLIDDYSKGITVVRNQDLSITATRSILSLSFYRHHCEPATLDVIANHCIAMMKQSPGNRVGHAFGIARSDLYHRHCITIGRTNGPRDDNPSNAAGIARGDATDLV